MGRVRVKQRVRWRRSTHRSRTSTCESSGMLCVTHSVNPVLLAVTLARGRAPAMRPATAAIDCGEGSTTCHQEHPTGRSSLTDRSMAKKARSVSQENETPTTMKCRRQTRNWRAWLNSWLGIRARKVSVSSRNGARSPGILELAVASTVPFRWKTCVSVSQSGATFKPSRRISR